MHTTKKMLALAAVAATVCVLSATAMGASASMESTLPVLQDNGTGDVTTTTVTDVTTTTEETTTTTTTAPTSKTTPPFSAVLNVQAGTDQVWDPAGENEVIITGNGTYSVSYTFLSAEETISLLLVDTDIDAYAFAPQDSTKPIQDSSVKLAVSSIELVRSTGESEPIAYKGPSDDSVILGADGSSMQLNVLYTWNGVNAPDIDTTLPGGGAAAGDKIKVNFTVSGLPEDPATTTTTTTTTNSVVVTSIVNSYNYGGGSYNTPSYSSGGSSSYVIPTTGTVSETADPGVVALIVGAVAAGAAAVGAMTMTKRRKK